jgi:hypothetical protein
MSHLTFMNLAYWTDLAQSWRRWAPRSQLQFLVVMVQSNRFCSTSGRQSRHSVADGIMSLSWGRGGANSVMEIDW